MLPEEVWLAIANYARYARDIEQLSKALFPLIKSQQFHSELAWIRQRTAGLYINGCEFIVQMIHKQRRPPTVIKATFEMLSERQKIHLCRRLATGRETKYDGLEILDYLINQCNISPKGLEHSLRIYQLYQSAEYTNRLLSICGDHFDRKLIHDIQTTVTPERCYEAVMADICAHSYPAIEKADESDDEFDLIAKMLPYLADADWRGWMEESPVEMPMHGMELLLEWALIEGEEGLAKFIFDQGMMPGSETMWSNDRMITMRVEMAILLAEYGSTHSYFLDYCPYEFNLIIAEVLREFGFMNGELVFENILNKFDFEKVCDFLYNDGLFLIDMECFLSTMTGFVELLTACGEVEKLNRVLGLKILRLVLMHACKSMATYLFFSYELDLMRAAIGSDIEVAELCVEHFRIYQAANTAEYTFQRRGEFDDKHYDWMAECKQQKRTEKTLVK